MQLKKYSDSIRETLFQLMKKDKKINLMGLGINDPNGIFGIIYLLKNNRFFAYVTFVQKILRHIIFVHFCNFAFGAMFPRLKFCAF